MKVTKKYAKLEKTIIELDDSEVKRAVFDYAYRFYDRNKVPQFAPENISVYEGWDDRNNEPDGTVKAEVTVIHETADNGREDEHDEMD